MKYQHKTLGQFGHRFLVHITSAEIEKIKKTVIEDFHKIQGSDQSFKANLSPAQIEQQLGPQIWKTVRERILYSYFTGILNDLKLLPCAQVKFNVGNLIEGQDFEFIGEFETRPQIRQLNTQGIAFDVRAPEISEQMLGQEVRRLLLPFGQAKDQPDDYQAQWNSLVHFELNYILDGKELPHLAQKRQGLMLGSKQYKFKIDQHFIGMKAQQTKLIDYQIPNLFNIPELTGKKVKLKLFVTKIQEIVTPLLNDEFIRGQFSGKPGAPTSAEEFKSFVREQLSNRLTFESFTQSKMSTLKRLVEINQFPVPQSMIQEQKKAIIAREAKEAESKGRYEPPAANSKQDQDLTRYAADVVRATLIVEFLAVQNELKVTPLDIEAHLIKTAKIFGTTPEALKTKFQTQESKDQLRYAVLENKVVNLFSKSA
jgi:trigger factor